MIERIEDHVTRRARCGHCDGTGSKTGIRVGEARPAGDRCGFCGGWGYRDRTVTLEAALRELGIP